MTQSQYIFYAQILHALAGTDVKPHRLSAYYMFIDYTEIGFDRKELLRAYYSLERAAALPGEPPPEPREERRRQSREERVILPKAQHSNHFNESTRDVIVGAPRVIRFNRTKVEEDQ